MGVLAGVGVRDAVGYDDQLRLVKCLHYLAGVGQAHRGVGTHYPDCFHAPGCDGIKQIHRFQARLLRQRVGLPESTYFVPLGGGEIHVRRQLVGKAAHFTATHGIGLAGEGKR